ncbi:hypothetical protein AAC387_Pa01g2136 [Persea americana]
MDRSWILHYQNRFSAEYIAGIADMPREKRAKRARQIAAALRPHGWKKLDSGIKLAVITAVKQFFYIGDYED